MKYRRRKKIEIEPELKKVQHTYDVQTSLVELIKMFELLNIKFDNHIEMVKKGNIVPTSLNGLYQQFLKLYKSVENYNG